MNDINERIQRVFCTLLGATTVSWSANFNHDQLQHMSGVIWQHRPGGDFTVEALIAPKFDNGDGTNTITRLQALRVDSGHLMSFDMKSQTFEGLVLVELGFRYSDTLEAFITDYENLIWGLYEREFTKDLEETLSSP